MHPSVAGLLKRYEGIEVHKVYLSAILDLYDRRIVSFVIGERKDNPLVFKTFDKAVHDNPGATPFSILTVVSSTQTAPSTISWKRPI